MRGFVVDASVVVEYLLKTELGRAVTFLLENSALAAPQVMDIEVLSAFRRSVLNEGKPERTIIPAIDFLSTWQIQRVSHSHLLRNTWNYYRNVTAYDSIYLAAAKSLGVDVLTADSKLTRAPGLDVVVHDVRDASVLAELEANQTG